MTAGHLLLTTTTHGKLVETRHVTLAELSRGLVLGRGAPIADLPDSERRVSRNQAEIRFEGGRLRLVHRGRNPTRVVVNDPGESRALAMAGEALELGRRFTLAIGPFRVEGHFEALADTVTEEGVDPGAGEPSGEPVVAYRSEAMAATLARARASAQSDWSVLILGETGSGKDVIARVVHANSRRRDEPCVAKNVTEIPTDGNLGELELFGRVPDYPNRGDAGHAGLFEQAHRGTLFLDEIGDLAPRLQPMLLRVVDTRRVTRLGADRTRREHARFWDIPIDVRLVLATHQDLAKKVENGSFRQDLYYRICENVVRVPPLRERPDDVEPLLEHFLRTERPPIRPGPLRLSAPVLDTLRSHPWPGNVRQLQKLVRQLYGTLPAAQEEVSMLDLDAAVVGAAGGDRGIREVDRAARVGRGSSRARRQR